MKGIKGKSVVSQILTVKGKTQEKLRKVLSFHRNECCHGGPDVVVTNPNRRITVAADMYVEDEETFGSNETTRRQKTNAAILSTLGLAQTIMNFEVRMGGEIRVDFSITAALIDENGNATIDGTIKLFEGDSESTSDLDGERQFQLYCPAGATINHFVRVDNDDEGGDYATVQINITNAPI